ncbi:MAG: sigma-70 family RNA polymerase sigma factor [Planctomycetota bacterium]|nr:sigma-70 family RNA polymerase sigma factor [Planctomycetota bacterium]
MNGVDPPKSVLEQISTCWPSIRDPVQFVMRYARAIRKYVAAVVRDSHDADEVAQDFLVRVFEKGFCPENVSRGRFRDYLRSAVRYVAISHLRKKRPGELNEQALSQLTQPEVESEAERAFTSEWRACLLDRVWQSVEQLERQTDGNLDYTVLKLHVADPTAHSDRQAAELSRLVGREIRADAFRKQLSRARKRFAQQIVNEVRKTLQQPTAESMEDELIDLDLMEYVREFLKRPE